MGYGPQGHKESDKTERLTLQPLSQAAQAAVTELHRLGG